MGSKPLKVMLWVVVSSSEVAVKPYSVVLPYSTWLLPGSFVVQVMIALASVSDEAEMFLITGGVVSTGGGCGGVVTGIVTLMTTDLLTVPPVFVAVKV